ncbi:hypothetical protein Dimus_002834 [Dionaea muscipula]
MTRTTTQGCATPRQTTAISNPNIAIIEQIWPVFELGVYQAAHRRAIEVSAESKGGVNSVDGGVAFRLQPGVFLSGFWWFPSRHWDDCWWRLRLRDCSPVVLDDDDRCSAYGDTELRLGGRLVCSDCFLVYGCLYYCIY